MGRRLDSTSIDVSEELTVGDATPENSVPAVDTESDAQPAQAELDGQSGLPAAFELIAEACAAVKIAEDRASLAEEALEEATLYYTGQIEELTEKLSNADRRIEIAERQAQQAEERLRIFCQTILTTMHNS